jgi:hypothetical protein
LISYFGKKKKKTPKSKWLFFFFVFVFPPPYSGTQIQAKPIWRSTFVVVSGAWWSLEALLGERRGDRLLLREKGEMKKKK